MQFMPLVMDFDTLHATGDGHHLPPVRTLSAIGDNLHDKVRVKLNTPVPSRRPLLHADAAGQQAQIISVTMLSHSTLKNCWWSSTCSHLRK